MNLRDLLEVWYGPGMWLAAAAGLGLALLVGWVARRNGEGTRALCLAAIGPLTVIPGLACWLFAESRPENLDAGAARTAATLAMFLGLLGVGGLAVCAAVYLGRQQMPQRLLAAAAAIAALAVLAPGALGLAGGFEDSAREREQFAGRVEEGPVDAPLVQQASDQAGPAEVVLAEGKNTSLTLEGSDSPRPNPGGEDPGKPVEGPLAEGPTQALSTWFEQEGQSYAGDCVLASSTTDAFKRCTAVYSVSPDIWAFASGPTFSDYDTWLFVERLSNEWRVFHAAPLAADQFERGELPWPAGGVLPGSSGVGLRSSASAVVTATGSCFNVQAQPSFSSERLTCLDDGTVVRISERQVANGYVWYEVDGEGWVAGPWLMTPVR